MNVHVLKFTGCNMYQPVFYNIKLVKYHAAESTLWFRSRWLKVQVHYCRCLVQALRYAPLIIHTH